MILRTKSRLKAKTGIELTAMVDVVFLLIIFFMTSSTLVKVRALKVDLPQANNAQREIKDQITLTIQSDRKLYINGQQTSVSDLKKQLETLATATQQPVVIIEGDKNVAYQDIISLMSLAKEAGVVRVSLAARVQ
ncbi:biopolymer transport protein ExbD [Spirochaetota bacterium]|nr:biopolymer transport protein ExbD [Spirochaetota bacterium]